VVWPAPSVVDWRNSLYLYFFLELNTKHADLLRVLEKKNRWKARNKLDLELTKPSTGAGHNHKFKTFPIPYQWSIIDVQPKNACNSRGALRINNLVEI
jgi:hypothetical protein